MLIMLLNFLIALISSSYEKVMEDSQIIKFNLRCEINCESTLIYFYYTKFRKSTNYSDVFGVSAAVVGDQNEEDGIVE